VTAPVVDSPAAARSPADLSEDQLAFREAARDFAQAEFAPHAA